MEPTPVLTEELKRHLAETRAANEYRSQQVRLMYMMTMIMMMMMMMMKLTIMSTGVSKCFSFFHLPFLCFHYIPYKT